MLVVDSPHIVMDMCQGKVDAKARSQRDVLVQTKVQPAPTVGSRNDKAAPWSSIEYSAVTMWLIGHAMDTATEADRETKPFPLFDVRQDTGAHGNRPKVH